MPPITHELIFQILGLIVVIAPLTLAIVLGVLTLASAPPSERVTAILVQICTWVGLSAALGVLCLMLLWGPRYVPVNVGQWVEIKDYHFHVKFVFDRLSVPIAILTFVLCGVIGGFAARYMHREPGYNRFFVLFSLFMLGMILASLAGTIETLFTGWELVGLSSALLVAFFHERAAPVRNGLRVWAVYRISDAALLIGSVVMHHLHGHGDFEGLLGAGHGVSWPSGHVDESTINVLLVGFLLLIAAAGKSALVPFSGWLPRAMEGPTPSSAVFYGALSVHLGAFLLLRISPLLDESLVLSCAVMLIGLITAGFASFAGRVQTDIKSALSFASLTQVGIIVAEIGFGYFWEPLRYVALAHILGHACFRTLQFLRAPTLLYDYGTLENALGSRLPRLANKNGWLPESTRAWLYRLALEKGCLDSWLQSWIVDPFLSLFRFCDRCERSWAAAFDRKEEAEELRGAVVSREKSP